MHRTQRILNEALISAAADGEADGVVKLLKAGADMHDPLLVPHPLCAAAAHGHVDVVRAFVRAGATSWERNRALGAVALRGPPTPDERAILRELLGPRRPRAKARPGPQGL
jgi:hypothetical protein